MALTAEQQADLDHQRGNRARTTADLVKAEAAGNVAEVTKLRGWLAAQNRRIAELEALAAAPLPPAPPPTVPPPPELTDAQRRAAALEAAHKRQEEAMRAVVEALTLLEGLQAKAAEFVALLPPFLAASKAAASGLADAGAALGAAGYSPDAANRTADAIRKAIDPVVSKLEAA